MRWLILVFLVLASGCQSDRVMLPHLTADRTPTTVETPRAENYASAIAFAADADLLVIGMVDDSAQLHRASDFKLLARRPGRQVNAVDQLGVNAVAISPRGDRIVVHHSSGTWLYDGRLRPIAALARPETQCLGFLWLRDGRSVVGFCHEDGLARIIRWDTVDRRETHRLALDEKIRSWHGKARWLQLSGGRLVVAFDDDVYELTPELNLLQTWEVPRPEPKDWMEIAGLGEDANGRIRVAGLGQLWSINPTNYTGPRGSEYLKPPERFGDVFFTPDGSGYATIGAHEPDLRPIRFVNPMLDVSTLLDTGEPLNATRILLTARWESPTTLAIYSHVSFHKKPGRLQRHRVHLHPGDVQLPRPEYRHEPEPAKQIDPVFPDHEPTPHPGGGHSEGGLFGNPSDGGVFGEPQE